MKVEVELARLVEATKKLSSENQTLKRESDVFRKQVGEQQAANSTLQNHIEDLKLELSEIRLKEAEFLKFLCDKCHSKSLTRERELRDRDTVEHQSGSALTHSCGTTWDRPMKKKLDDLELPKSKRIKLTEVASKAEDTLDPYARGKDLRLSTPLGPSTPAQELPCLPRTAYVTTTFLTYLHKGSMDSPAQRNGAACYSTDTGAKQLFVISDERQSPNLPRALGSHGEILTMYTEYVGQTFKLFCYDKSTSSMEGCQYKGEYTATFSRNMEKDEFRRLKRKKEKDLWVKEILGRSWNSTIRARVNLRIRGIEITHSSVEETINENERGTMKETLGSLERGEEIIKVLSVTCVGYDTKFAEKLNRCMKV